MVSASYYEFMDRLNERDRTLAEVIKELQNILCITSQYNIKKFSDVSIYIKPSNGVPIPSGKRLTPDVAIDMKNRIKKLKRKYARVFPKEFKYLQPSKLEDFRCLSIGDLFGSDDFIVSLNNTLEALQERQKEVLKSKGKLTKMASEGPLKHGGLAAFSNLKVSRILNNYSTEEMELERFQRDMALEEEKASKRVNASVDDQVKGTLNTIDNAKGKKSEGSAIAELLGLVAYPIELANDFMEESNKWLLSKQYPNSILSCYDKPPLDTNTLTSSRESSALNSDSISKRSSNNKGIDRVGQGRIFLEKPETKQILTRIDRFLYKLNLVQQQKYQRRYNTLLASIRNSNTSESVKEYSIQLLKLEKELSDLLNS